MGKLTNSQKESITEKTSERRITIDPITHKILQNKALISAAKLALNGNIYELVRLTGKSRTYIENIIRKIKNMLFWPPYWQIINFVRRKSFGGSDLRQFWLGNVGKIGNLKF